MIISLSITLTGTLIATLISLIIFLVYYVPWKHSKYYEKMGIPYIRPKYLNMYSLFTGQTTIAESELKLYKECLDTKSGIVGLTDMFVNKYYYITDLDLMKNIYVKDFNHFVDRRKLGNQNSNAIFTKMLFGLDGEEWKGMRSKLSPSFTTGKIRRMFKIFVGSSDRMCKYLENIVSSNGNDFDLCQVYSKYAIDVIANCAFGIDSKSFSCPPGEQEVFEAMAQKLQFKFEYKIFLKFMLVFSAPKIANFFNIQTIDPAPNTYFTWVIKDVMKRRRESGDRQEDFLQLMMDAQDGLLKAEEKETLEVMTGTVSEEGDAKNAFKEVEKENLNFDDDFIVANCILFLLAGFDTLQTLLIFAAYQVALNEDVQGKLYKEIKESLKTSKGNMTYEGVAQMSYLDMVINETLRLYPPVQRLERYCTKDYSVPGTSLVIKKGTLVGLSAYGAQHDPKYYKNPEKFDPERFLPERKSQRNPYAFSPFGHGPRNCIGMRFALMEAKAVIVSLVHNFKLEPCSRTTIPMKFGTSSSLKPKDGMWLNVTPRANIVLS